MTDTTTARVREHYNAKGLSDRRLSVNSWIVGTREVIQKRASRRSAAMSPKPTPGLHAVWPTLCSSR
jgi:hypothetical protein